MTRAAVPVRAASSVQVTSRTRWSLFSMCLAAESWPMCPEWVQAPVKLVMPCVGDVSCAGVVGGVALDDERVRGVREVDRGIAQELAEWCEVGGASFGAPMSAVFGDGAASAGHGAAQRFPVHRDRLDQGRR
ncbi:hypothetical protein [Amycolatopsis sp. FDAARGOS 1241]|uniref:hypothetical protein n=1 Tax=Amycolatopsis sp. FDAARGOS 1241 TaxID=2778070 RepID=UPI00194EF63D|nr:hypothetical protein [Amycolatopsis sp. FDAARGOS 1241]QRP48168.1 hypothetical protein I6J71_09970 [Amycolatopsis sp. FDAARGOS 1241]